MENERTSHRWLTILATVVAVTLLYVLSYPPVLRFYGGADRKPWFDVHQYDTSNLPVYRPVEFLMDHTPIAIPMMWWAHVWDVDAIVLQGFISRNLDMSSWDVDESP